MSTPLCREERQDSVPSHSRQINFSCIFFPPENVFILLDLVKIRALGGKTDDAALAGGQTGLLLRSFGEQGRDARRAGPAPLGTGQPLVYFFVLQQVLEKKTFRLGR